MGSITMASKFSFSCVQAYASGTKCNSVLRVLVLFSLSLSFSNFTTSLQDPPFSHYPTPIFSFPDFDSSLASHPLPFSASGHLPLSSNSNLFHPGIHIDAVIHKDQCFYFHELICIIK
ncbi:hypothetical protein RIF29_42449 [Crotalaria pallida]|uniref:Uncharacterized protein n=1 Tax=Crotalaria pallida TaxID=3830 RepID=A0AAN9E6Y4_CROPI